MAGLSGAGNAACRLVRSAGRWALPATVAGPVPPTPTHIPPDVKGPPIDQQLILHKLLCQHVSHAAGGAGGGTLQCVQQRGGGGHHPHTLAAVRVLLEDPQAPAAPAALLLQGPGSEG